jgi:hypothetical protein
MWHRVALVWTKISEELITTIIMVKIIKELVTTLAVTCNVRPNSWFLQEPQGITSQKATFFFSIWGRSTSVGIATDYGMHGRGSILAGARYFGLKQKEQQQQTNSVAFSPQVYYTDWPTAAAGEIVSTYG